MFFFGHLYAISRNQLTPCTLFVLESFTKRKMHSTKEELRHLLTQLLVVAIWPLYLVAQTQAHGVESENAPRVLHLAVMTLTVFFWTLILPFPLKFSPIVLPSAVSNHITSFFSVKLWLASIVQNSSKNRYLKWLSMANVNFDCMYVVYAWSHRSTINFWVFFQMAKQLFISPISSFWVFSAWVEGKDESFPLNQRIHKKR